MGEELVISDINGICRLCLKGDGTIIPIFGRENTSRDCIPLSKKILDCISVEVTDEDGLPNMICVGCVHQVDSWHGFKNTCDTSQKKLTSWLQKTRPDIFAKNEAANRRRNKTNSVESSAQSSSVIDLSSGDDDLDVIITHQPLVRRALSRSRRRRRSRPSSHSQNIEVISIGTNEIEILPVDDVCLNKKQINETESENIPSTSTASGLPDVVTGLATTNSECSATQNSPDDHILPDSDVLETLGNSQSTFSHQVHSEKENLTKDYLPKDIITDNDPDISQSPNPGKSDEDLHSMSIEQVQINESEFREAPENETSESQEKDVFADTGTVSLTENHNSLDHQVNSNWSESDGVAEATQVEGIVPLDKTSLDSVKISERSNSLTPHSNLTSADKVTGEPSSESEKPNEEHVDHSAGLSSSLVIEKVTSLTTNPDTERMDEDTFSRDLIHEASDREVSSKSWSQTSHDEDSMDVQPDIVMCDTAMVVNIKEEPLSASEATADEEDPLNFHSIMIKREIEDYTSEPEDIKPNVRLLNEAMVSHYVPKKLKSGKIHCEPCRVSFLNDVYYERHTISLRHKLNYKLFRSGKAPTKKRGKSLIQAIMGNNYEFPRRMGKFQCTQCPSAFKHLRNLKTHQKKTHLAQAENSTHRQPARLSAQNLSFVNSDETKCDLCDQTFTTFPALVSHKRFCGRSETRVCNWCHQNFTTTSLFFKHRKECLKLYRTQKSNVSHQVPPGPVAPVVPLDGTVLACTLCNLTFQSSPDLISHMQQNHMDFGKPESPIELPNFTKPNSSSRFNDSRLHYCKYCLRSFPSHGALTSHTGYHARKNVYCCKFCKQSYRDKLSFRQHMKVHISDPKLNRNVCWICYTPFSTQNDLINHKKIHANIKMKIFSCGICSNSYNTRELLSRHKKQAHDSQMMVMFNHDQFEPSSENAATFESKAEMMDEDNKLFKCKICKKRFTTLGNLKRHGAAHKRPPNMSTLGAVNIEHFHQNRCSGCFRTFKTQSGLLNHRTVCTRVKKSAIPNVNPVYGGNPQSKPIKCKDCKKWFASQSSLYKHRVMKRCSARVQPNKEEPTSQLKPQNCPNCDQQFLSEESLFRHKQHCKPSIERLTCDCGEVFFSVEQKLAHADSCLANCTCKTCNLKFNSPEELESHKLVCREDEPNPMPSASPKTSLSSDNRLPPVVCNKCNKKFVYIKCLKIHQDKCLYDRWPCSNCMEIFPTETALATHKSHKACKHPKLGLSPLIPSLQQESPTFKCEHCPLRFTSGNELQQHVYLCGNKPKMRRKDRSSGHRNWSCDLCDKSFLWKANLHRHQKIIHKIGLSIAEPPLHRTTSSPRDGSPVQTNTEKESGYFKCQKCPDIIFHKRQGFLEHQMAHARQEGKQMYSEEEEHTEGGMMLTCELCDKKLPEALYPMHMDEHMNDDFEESQESAKDNSTPSTFPCDICGKVFLAPASRNSHRAIHYRVGNVMAHLAHKRSPKKKLNKVKHIRCTTCNKLLSINSMPKHKMMHVREAAEFYGENQSSSPSKTMPAVSTPRSATPNISELLSTTQESPEEESGTVFPCPKCDRSFKLRKSLLEHLKGHQDDSFETESTSSNTGPVEQFPYKCAYCDLSWKFKSVYERHMTSKKHLEIQKQLSGII